MPLQRSGFRIHSFRIRSLFSWSAHLSTLVPIYLPFFTLPNSHLMIGRAIVAGFVPERGRVQST